LSIKEGEFLALLGPNGAGKSTFIKILIGVLAYDNGEVRVLGQEPLQHRDKVIGKLGIVFGQRSRMWHDLPVKESFELTKRLYIPGYPKTKDEKLVGWEKFLIDSIDIASLLDRQVKKLSLGEKMRCELVNTLLYNPELIFLDEPTIGLDVVSKQRIREALKILHSHGKTILLTSHDTGDIEKLCQRVIVINKGEVVVDLGMDEFMQLDDELEVTVKLKSQNHSSLDKMFDGVAKATQISSYEILVVGKKVDLNEIMKTIFQKLPVADIDLGSERVEKILVDIYQK
jgi:ABC-2 type transport system ATP-binding protein